MGPWEIEEARAMTTALVYAGGPGGRPRPKELLEIYGKPIIIYTLEHFEYHGEVDAIMVVCAEERMGELKGLLRRFGITKARGVVPGGATGQGSVYRGLLAMGGFSGWGDTVLIHDGARPLIDGGLISRSIRAVREHGSAITCEPAREGQVRSLDGRAISGMPPRRQMYTARAPQSFRYGEVRALYEAAERDGAEGADPAQLCSLYKKPMHMVKGPRENIRVEGPADYHICRALYDAREARQMLGP